MDKPIILNRKAVMNKSYKLILLFFALLGAFVFYSGIAGPGNLKMAKMENVGNKHKAVGLATPIVSNSPSPQVDLITPIADNSSSQQAEKKQAADKEPQDSEEEEEGC
jgi:hypothetical protein